MVLKKEEIQVDNYNDAVFKHDYLKVAESVVEKLPIYVVIQQRELLLAYHKYLDSLNDPTVYNASESMIDDYLANNCC